MVWLMAVGTTLCETTVEPSITGTAPAVSSTAELIYKYCDGQGVDKSSIGSIQRGKLRSQGPRIDYLMLVMMALVGDRWMPLPYNLILWLSTYKGGEQHIAEG